MAWHGKSWSAHLANNHWLSQTALLLLLRASKTCTVTETHWHLQLRSKVIKRVVASFSNTTMIITHLRRRSLSHLQRLLTLLLQHLQSILWTRITPSPPSQTNLLSLWSNYSMIYYCTMQHLLSHFLLDLSTVHLYIQSTYISLITHTSSSFSSYITWILMYISSKYNNILTNISLYLYRSCSKKHTISIDMLFIFQT